MAGAKICLTGDVEAVVRVVSAGTWKTKRLSGRGEGSITTLNPEQREKWAEIDEQVLNAVLAPGKVWGGQESEMLVGFGIHGEGGGRWRRRTGSWVEPTSRDFFTKYMPINFTRHVSRYGDMS